ncbi:hypothetical protein SADUNF_Sadunf16G0095600 [Salix dunnii]|uniref:Uncharacterized protein n=1 Tax=Salix dunnii TaxID=1413687 RepID=A0A835JAS4_9ROSI|nr:hypothetical protein SADUNF_Sadunf16G0095600 [Salix dunnii]
MDAASAGREDFERECWRDIERGRGMGLKFEVCLLFAQYKAKDHPEKKKEETRSEGVTNLLLCCTCGRHAGELSPPSCRRIKSGEMA